MIKKKRSKSGYWFTIQSPNGQTLATSETYTTAAMRDKGIEAVKKVVVMILYKDGRLSITGNVPKEAFSINFKGSGALGDALKSGGPRVSRRPSDTFHLENAKGKIVKR